jgi:hypothetical protein
MFYKKVLAFLVSVILVVGIVVFGQVSCSKKDVDNLIQQDNNSSGGDTGGSSGDNGSGYTGGGSSGDNGEGNSGGGSSGDIKKEIYMTTPLRGAFPFYMKDNTIQWMDGMNFILDEKLERFNYDGIKYFNRDSFLEVMKFAKSNKFFTMWFPYAWFSAGTPSSWYNITSIQEAMNKGYIPIFLLYYFGDRFIDSPPSDSDIQAYYQDVGKFADFISQLKGEKIVIIEPEFNKPYISNPSYAKKMADVYSKAIDILKAKDNEIKVSLCMMDTGSRGVEDNRPECGFENCALGDISEWSKADAVYKYLVDKLDYISFQEMVSQFSRNPQNPGTWNAPILKRYTEKEVGIDYLHIRVSNFSQFLYQKYHKLVILPYIAIATGVWDDKNGNGKVEEDEFSPDGWNEKLYNFYYNIAKMKESLAKNGLYIYGPMELIDDPQHDKGGYQYFNRNEYHLGIINTGAKDDVDTALFGNLKFKVKIETP